MGIAIRTPITAVVVIGIMTSLPDRALAWGDEGHEIVALIAEHYLTDTARAQVQALLTTDGGSLTAHDVASEATWADKFRDSDRNTTKVHYNETHQWHFVDIELANPDIDAACFQHPALPAGKVASAGAASDCVVDKIDEFKAELADASTNPTERLEALQFLLHFVGDLHQPLHASDDQDEGGNAKHVTAPGHKSGVLHHFWDTEFVQALGADPNSVADTLIAEITPAQETTWSTGTASTWAMETFEVARTHAYQLPKPNSKGVYALSAKYLSAAETAVGEQLERAGVRLATVLNAALR